MTTPAAAGAGLSVDVAVIGAGIAGASAAWAIAERASVALIEMEPQPGMHATGRSAALLNVSSGTRLVCELAEASRAFLEQFCDATLLTRRGLLWLGDDPGGELIANAGGRAHRVTPDAIVALVPTVVDPTRGGVFEPDAATIDVAALLAGYVAGLRRRGGVLSTASEALRIERRGQRWAIDTTGGRIAADVVVDAAGAWGDVVAARAGVAPLGLHAVRRTAALAATGVDVTGWPMVMASDGSWYAEPESGGILISPGDETPSDPCDATPDEIDVAIAIDRVNAALDLGIRSVRRAWAGLRTFTGDRSPAVGPDRHHPGFVWLVGQGGAGIKTAPALAEIVARSVLDGEAPPSELSPRRFVA